MGTSYNTGNTARSPRADSITSSQSDVYRLHASERSAGCGQMLLYWRVYVGARVSTSRALLATLLLRPSMHYGWRTTATCMACQVNGPGCVPLQMAVPAIDSRVPWARFSMASVATWLGLLAE